MRAGAAGVYGVGTANPLRDHLLSLGEEVLARSVDRHEITSLAAAYELLDNAYG